MLSNRSKGMQFEDQALHYLQRRGLKLVQRNFSSRFGEIDLIMLHAQTLCFIEVKFRSNNQFGGTAYSIPVSKQRKITKTALLFITSNKKYQKQNFRFDALFITPSDDQQDNSIEWIENAFNAESADFY